MNGTLSALGRDLYCSIMCGNFKRQHVCRFFSRFLAGLGKAAAGVADGKPQTGIYAVPPLQPQAVLCVGLQLGLQPHRAVTVNFGPLKLGIHS